MRAAAAEGEGERGGGPWTATTELAGQVPAAQRARASWSRVSNAASQGQGDRRGTNSLSLQLPGVRLRVWGEGGVIRLNQIKGMPDTQLVTELRYVYAPPHTGKEKISQGKSARWADRETAAGGWTGHGAGRL